MKKTVVIGASTNPTRYAYMAAGDLVRYGHPMVPVGIKSGAVHGMEIQDLRKKPAVGEVDTVTMYIGPARQPEWYDYILSLRPKRVIFNPGTENSEFSDLLKQNKIEPVEACTLVMLRTGQY